MKVCVTGGAGFIGSHLVDRLVAEGDDVTVIDDLSTGSRANLASSDSRIRFVHGDVRLPAAVTEAFTGCEVVFHHAALAAVPRSVERPRDVAEVNITGTLNVLLAARVAGVRRVVFASSSSVYGNTPTLPKCETMLGSPRSPYAATKAAGESLLAGFHGAFGLEYAALRYFNVFGPRQSAASRYAAVVPTFVDAMLAGRPPHVHGDGLQTRDFTFIEDVVEANLRAARAPVAMAVTMNVGGGRRISILDLIGVIADATGYTGEVTHGPPRPGDVRDSLADIQRAQQVLGWSPRVGLVEGIRRTVGGRRSTVAAT
jgi:UDP-glucose 4-epimerase